MSVYGGGGNSGIRSKSLSGFYPRNWKAEVRSKSIESEYKIDVITVHDVDTQASVSTAPLGPTDIRDNSEIILLDTLKNDIPKARLINFEYDLGDGRIDLRGRAIDFLDAVSILRKSGDELIRPIVLIGFGLGGTIIKQALRIGNFENRYLPITARVRSLIFFGTPHRKLSHPDWEQLCVRLTSNILKTRFLQHVWAEVAKDLPETLVEVSDFRHFAERYRILSFSKEAGRACQLQNHPSEECPLLSCWNKLEVSSETSHVWKGATEDKAWGTVILPGDENYKMIVAEIEAASRSREPGAFLSLDSDLYSVYVRKNINLNTHLYFMGGRYEPPQWVLDAVPFSEWLADGSASSLLQLSGSSYNHAGLLIFLLTELRSRPFVGSIEDEKGSTTFKMNPIVLYCSLSQGSLKGREVVASQAIFFSLIYQLLCYKPVLHADLQKLISEDPSDESLDFSAHVPWTLLRTLLVAPGQGQTVFCCVDVQEDGDFTQRFLQDLYDLQIGCKLKILVTGTVTIKGRSEKSGPIYSINLDEHDFSNLTEAGICELIRKIPQYDDFRKDIERAVYFESNNPRLSVCLKLKYISSLFQVIPSMPSIIRQHLALLQCDQPALYRQILAGVAPNDHAWARKILSWILFSFRPLRCAELAVAISARSTNILEDISLDIEHDLHRVLGQLLDIETGDVRLIHPSLKTFFLTDAPKDDKWYSFKAPHEQHRIMSSDCLGYLMRFSRDDVGCYVELGQKGPFLNVAARDQDFVQLPFLEYAITNWHRHYQERFDHESALFDQDASIMDREEVIGFFNSPGLRDWCLNRRRLTTSKANASEADMSPECCALPLQHAAELGLIDVVQAYLDDHGHGESLPLKDLTKALDLASGQGHCKIVEMILKSMIEASKHTITANADIESEVEGLDSYTLGPAFAVALRNAAMKGYKEILDSVLQLSSSCATKLNGQDISSALTLAAARGRIYAVNKLLGEDLVDVNNTQEENGNQLSGALSWPPLYNAATHGHVDVISLLLSRGATLLALGPADQTSLHTASKNGQGRVVERLLEEYKLSNTDIDTIAVGGGGTTALHLAAEHGHLESLKQLLAAGSDPNARNVQQRTPLHYACEKSWVLIVRELVGNPDVDVEAVDYDGMAPIHYAAMRGQVHILEILLQRGGSDPMLRESNNNWTPLHYAAMNGHEDAVRILVEAGSNVDARDSSKDTPLHLAVQNGHHRCVEELIKAGAFEDSRNSLGATALYVAATRFDLKSMDLLLAAGANPDLSNSSGWAPIHWTVVHREIQMAKDLLKYDANINLRGDSVERTVCGLAVDWGYLDILKELCKLGADPNHVDRFGGNSLYRAIKSDDLQLETVKFLIEEQKMDPNFVPKVGKSPGGYLMLACEAYSNDKSERSLSVIRYLVEEVGLDPFPQFFTPTAPMIPLICGIEDIPNEDLENNALFKFVVEYLTNKRNPLVMVLLTVAGLFPRLEDLPVEHFDIDRVDGKGRQLIFYAAASAKRPEILQFFLRRGQSKDMQDFSGRKPIDVAFNSDVREFLLRDTSEESITISNGNEKQLKCTVIRNILDQKTPFRNFLGATQYWCDLCQELFGGIYYHCCTCKCNDPDPGKRGSFDICLGCYNGGLRCPGNHDDMTYRYFEDRMFSIPEFSPWVSTGKTPLQKD